MFVLIVDIKVKPGREQEAEKTYREPFRPAILAQPGFVSVEFLRPQEDFGLHLLGSVSALTLFHQPDRDLPMVPIERIPFGRRG